MTHFEAVRCPACGVVVMEAGPAFRGMARVKCHKCRRRVWVSSDGIEVRTGMVDKPVARLSAAPG